GTASNTVASVRTTPAPATVRAEADNWPGLDVRLTGLVTSPAFFTNTITNDKEKHRERYKLHGSESFHQSHQHFRRWVQRKLQVQYDRLRRRKGRVDQNSPRSISPVADVLANRSRDGQSEDDQER